MISIVKKFWLCS